jgi:serine/threonine-protein kinase
MDAERWRRVEEVLDVALASDGDDWSALLDEKCAGDPALRLEVTALLDRVTTARRYLELPPAASAAALIAEARELEAGISYEGRRIGAYRIVREIGRGGMSRVYLAERADGVFAQTVALKLLRANLDTEIDRSRFRAERQILATLNHANIARLLDGGVTDEGLPYLVLEHVEGEPIDRYCETRRCTVPERLALFATAARATQYAHTSLVVHRDLKPSNIYVARDGTIKLLDFGLAKLLRPDPAAPSLTTRVGQRWMTPEYAAPEQIRGDFVTTLADVYQLGVVLYELLAGRLPFAAHARSTHELEDAVLHVEPPPPSTIRPALAGDLDAVVMKALSKEPEQRYASPMAMVEDLQRYLDGRPVRARRITTLYRVGKFVRRHRAGVALGALAVVALGGAVARERTLRGRAESETRKARAVEDYLVSVFDVADPFAPADGRGENMTARAILDRGAARIDSVGDADVQAELRHVVGRVYTNLGLFDRAAPMLRKSLDRQRALHGARHAAVASAMAELGQVLLKQDSFDEAESLLRDALAQRRALLGNQNAETAESVDQLASLYQERSRYDAADTLFREALATRRSLLGDDDVIVARSLDHLALLLFHQGKYVEAEPLYRQALAIEDRQLGPDHPETAQTVHNLAQTLHMSLRNDEAETLYRRALATKRKVLGNAHPSVTVNLNNLANLLGRNKGELVEAEALAREALTLDRQIFGEKHGYVAASLDNLATLLRLRGEFAEATVLYRQALEVNRAVKGPEHNAVALNLNNLAATIQLTGDAATAIPLFRQSVAQYRKISGEKHPNFATVSLNLARALRDDGQTAEAEQIFRTIGAMKDSSKATERVPYLGAQLGLAQILLERGQHAEARPMLERTLAGLDRQYGDTSWRVAEVRLALGSCLAAGGERVRAEPMLRQAEALVQKVSRAQPRLTSQIRAALARYYPSPRRVAQSDR